MNFITINQLTRSQRHTFSAKTSGLSLIELLVSMALGILVLSSVIFVLGGSTNLSKSASALSLLEANGRMALQVLRNDIQHAAFQGCGSAKRFSITSNVPGVANVNFNLSGLSGWENPKGRQLDGKDPPNFPTSEKSIYQSQSITDSDIIRVSHTSAISANLKKDMNSEDDPIELDDPDKRFFKDDLVVIADCSGADLFKITNDPNNDSQTVVLEHTASGNTSDRLTQRYLVQDAQVMTFGWTSFFVGPTDPERQDVHGNIINSLWKTTSNSAPEEQIEGVDSLQIQYGEVLADGNITYRDANDPALNMSEVAMVKVSLLMSSNPIISDKNNTDFMLSGQKIKAAEAPDDFRLRKVYSTFIPLNNRKAFAANALDL